MARKRAAEDQPTAGRQISFRVPTALMARLEAVSLGLGLDISNLVRMVLSKHLHVYEAEVRALPDPRGRDD